jgi:hypothetical protein
MEVHNEKTQMKTLSESMNKLHAEGFTANFMVEEGKLKVIDTEKEYSPEDVKITNFYRFEGESDPADTSILYAIETNDAVKGIISDAYGVYADIEVSKFIDAVEEIMKRTKPSKTT